MTVVSPSIIAALSIGFESDYTVEESVGVFNVCVRALNVLDTEPLPFSVPILLSTELGTAGMSMSN